MLDGGKGQRGSRAFCIEAEGASTKPLLFAGPEACMESQPAPKHLHESKLLYPDAHQLIACCHAGTDPAENPRGDASLTCKLVSNPGAFQNAAIEKKSKATRAYGTLSNGVRE